jgi:hypothetical protein
MLENSRLPFVSGHCLPNNVSLSRICVTVHDGPGVGPLTTGRDPGVVVSKTRERIGKIMAT